MVNIARKRSKQSYLIDELGNGELQVAVCKLMKEFGISAPYAARILYFDVMLRPHFIDFLFKNVEQFSLDDYYKRYKISQLKKNKRKNQKKES